jgi:cysteate synthase
MKLMVSQNLPFKPIYDAWKAGSRDMLPLDDKLARKQVETINAKVLSNRKPPYSLAGGLFDALTDSGGDVLLATNEEAKEAFDLFEEYEGIDVHPAAAVATATLINKARNENLDKKAVIMLNVTGGGEKRFMQNKQVSYLKPSVVFDINPDPKFVKSRISELYTNI